MGGGERGGDVGNMWREWGGGWGGGVGVGDDVRLEGVITRHPSPRPSPSIHATKGMRFD